MAEYWSIEIFDGEIPASQWKQAYGAALVEAAISHGAADWSWLESRWGVVFEACFAEDAQWDAFRSLPAVRAALDAVPDPVNGLLVYRGRGGTSGGRRRGGRARAERGRRSRCRSPPRIPGWT